MIGGTRVDYFRNTLIKRAFIGDGTVNAGAAVNSLIQLWNPAGSGVTLIVSSIISFAGAVAEYIILTSHNVGLAGGVIATRSNKYLGEAAPLAEIRWERNAAVVGTQCGVVVPNNRSIECLENDPIIIPESFGICTTRWAVNTDNYTKFEWIEV